MRPRLSYANVVASLALFIALGGGAYAAVTLPARSVGTKQLEPRAVGAAQLKSSAVRSAQVKDRSLLTKDFAPGVLLRGERGLKGDPGVNGANGTNGTNGAKGDRGEKGDPGPSITRGVELDTCCPPIGPVAQTMVDLGLANGDEGDQFLVVPFSARVLAQATVGVRTNAATASQTRCFLEVKPAAAPSSEYDAMGVPTSASFPAISGYHVSVSLTGSAEVPAGTYNVRAACILNGAAVIEGLGGSLNVVAAPTS